MGAALGTIGVGLGVSWVAGRLREEPKTGVTVLGAVLGLVAGLASTASDPNFEPGSAAHGVIAFGLLPVAGAVIANLAF